MQALAEIIRKSVTDRSVLSNFSMTSSWSNDYIDFIQQKKKNLGTFQPLFNLNVMSKGMVEKAASTGLTYKHLQLAFSRGGESGRKNLLGEKFGDIVRVTKSKKVLSSLCDYFNLSMP